MPEYLTTKELAALLRIKERKVYDLAASGDVPCTKAMGKLLFRRDEIDAWLARGNTGSGRAPDRRLPNVFLGSHDPLLEWALRESRCGIATFFDGSTDGLDRFAAGEGIATGLHLYDGSSGSWNIEPVRKAFSGTPSVLIEWAKRTRGLIVPEALQPAIRSMADLKGKRVIPRQPEAGAQTLFLQELAEAGLSEDDLELTAPARTEQDAALAIVDGHADAAFGLCALAAQYRLPFVPVRTERFDILVDRRAWFEQPMQTFIRFCRSQPFHERAALLHGYDIGGAETVHFNGG